jgi:hypothetical protein
MDSDPALLALLSHVESRSLDLSDIGYGNGAREQDKVLRSKKFSEPSGRF